MLRFIYVFFFFLEYYEYMIFDWNRDNDINFFVKYYMINLFIRILFDGFYFLYCCLLFLFDNGESK